MDKWLMVGIMLLASVVISWVGALAASLLHIAVQPRGLPMPVVLSQATLYGGGVFVKLMKLCVLVGSAIVAVVALSAPS